MTFAYPWLLGLLVLLLPLAFWMLAPRLRRKRTPTFLFSAAHRLTGGNPTPRILLLFLLDLMVLVTLALLIICLARPQVLEHLEQDVEGIDIFIAFDMSGSMRALDYDASQVQAMEARGQTPKNRFEEAKETLVDFIGTRPHDRLGMVLFAQDAFLQFPLTLDHGLLIENVANLEIGDIEPAGTAIGNAVGRSLAGLTHSDAETRLIILITDGDRRGGNISPMQSAAMAAEMGVRIYPILVGRDGPTLVAQGQNPFTGRTAYRQAEFPINPQLMQDMADATGGRYFRALDAVSMKDDLHAILDEYDRSRLDDEGRVIRQEKYHLFLLAALLLFALQFLTRHTLCRSFP